VYGAALEEENSFGGFAMGSMLAALLLILYNCWNEKDYE